MKPDFPLPDTEWVATRGYFEAAARGELAIPRCAACGAWNWYPRDECRTCASAEMPWTATSGRGTLHSWAVVRRAFVPAFREAVPYVAALVALDEDPTVRIVTNLVDCDAESLRADMPVRAVFRPLDFPDASREVVAPMFTPAG